MKEALLYDKLEKGKVRCRLCAHGCLINKGGRGVCMVRENREGILYSLVWGRPVAANADPIEKKPLFHFLPGTRSYSIATQGCNFQCGFCQNWNISQGPRDEGSIAGGGLGGAEVHPQAVVGEALAQGCASISYTYTEPTIYFEYAHDCMKLAVERGLKNVFVSNGYESPECVEMCRGLLHGANIDLKAMNDAFYKSQCKARLEPVLDSLRNFHAAGVWLEVTTLLIPGKNDDPQEIKDLATFIAQELSPQVPWHVSAYIPRYKYEASGPPPTSAAAIEKALETGREAGLHYVYAGNLPGHDAESTFCAFCGKKVISRRMHSIRGGSRKGGKCQGCARPVPGVWS